MVVLGFKHFITIIGPILEDSQKEENPETWVSSVLTFVSVCLSTRGLQSTPFDQET